ncbi:hypothetical protein F0562_016803 [Nyssa sinensis]|uniref:ABC transporter domain-containing protein n=1 Tax=Nyssa sinensis TaxID=561372 RepID=A0A5J4ZHA9_9ASTE|nr:hypothetical protein F0562_016803 [Nyssa sinensis]
MLAELSRREKAAGIKPDPEIDAFMKATAMAGQETSLVTDYVLKILGLDICADIMVGDEMRRGISGGQKKRVTTAPETYDLFDDIILLSEGQIVYQGPRENVLEFFEHTGFKCPERKGVADFLQEVTSKKDQEQYWFRKNQPYRFISVPEFVQAFNSFHTGQQLAADLSVPYDKSRVHPAALVTEKIPLSFMESAIWIILTYYTIRFAPAASRFFRQFFAFFGIHQMALSLFRFIAAVGRTQVVANTLVTFTLLLVFVLAGFIVAKNDIKPWMIWGYYVSPMMYGQNAIFINEFLDKRWSTPNIDPRIREPTVGKGLLKSRGFFTDDYWFWICIGALVGFSLLFNILFIGALTFLNPLGDAKSVLVDEDDDKEESSSRPEAFEGIDMAVRNASRGSDSIVGVVDHAPRRGMVLPFQTLSLAFNHVNYYVDMPAEMKSQGVGEDRLQLLQDVSGAFRPGILTALVGVSGAGKTTLMDVLAGRKTGGYIEGSISISGYPKNQATFARMFIKEVMELVELNPIRDALVGLPGVDGLSTEQRKRLTIAIELVANPSIIFMDEPTSGLDARAAAVVIRTLLLMKRGGQVIYAGPLGRHSHKLVEYFEAIPGVTKIRDGYNPATWMLEVSAPSMEARLDVDFAESYANSSLYQRNQELIKELSTPPTGSKDLYFPTKARQQDLMNLLGAMYAAVFFLGASNASAVQSIVAIERTVFYRERAAGMYSALPFAFAQVAIETIYVAIQTFVYTLLLYSMISFEWEAAKFLWFYYYILMCFIYFTMYGMMVVALTPGHQIAAIVMSFFLGFWNLFSGFLIARPQIPIWWRRYYWASPVAWTLYGLVTSQVGDKNASLEVPGETGVTLKGFIKSNLGFDYDFLPAVAAAHLGWVLLFFFSLCLRYQVSELPKEMTSFNPELAQYMQTNI